MNARILDKQLVPMTTLNIKESQLVGRTYNEYKRMFNITRESLTGKKILDAAGGVSNFCAIGNVFGLDITAVDPVYHLMADELEVRCEDDLSEFMNQLPLVRDHYNWDFYGDLEGLRISRVKAYQTFLKDYQSRPKHYVQGTLLDLPFSDKSFDVSLVSHLMFLFDDRFNKDFHISALKELIRVTKEEIIIFPTKNIHGEQSEWVDNLRTSVEFLDYTFQIEATQFEFQKGNNCRLRIIL